MNCNILLATSQNGNIEIEAHIFELARELTKRGSKVAVASFGGDLEKSVSEIGIKHYTLPLNSKGTSQKEFEKIVFCENINIVHAHDKNVAEILGKLQKKLGFPFVTTVHENIEKKAFQKKINFGDKTLCLNNKIKNNLLENYKLLDENVKVTVFGIDTNKFSKNNDNISNEDNTIVYCDVLNKKTDGISYQLIESIKKLDNIIDNIKCVIIGNGDDLENINSKINEINEELKRKAIILVENRNDIVKILQQAKLFVGEKRAVLEAVSCEVPAIVCGNSGYLGLLTKDKIDSFIETEYCAKGMEKSDTDKLSQEIGEFFGMWDDEREELGNTLRQFVADNYSVEKMADDAQKVYESLLK